MITEQRADYLKLAISLNRERMKEKYKTKLLAYLEERQKEETIEILLENSNIKKVIKKIDEERGIWMSPETIQKEIDKFFI